MKVNRYKHPRKKERNNFSELIDTHLEAWRNKAQISASKYIHVDIARGLSFIRHVRNPEEPTIMYSQLWTRCERETCRGVSAGVSVRWGWTLEVRFIRTAMQGSVTASRTGAHTRRLSQETANRHPRGHMRVHLARSAAAERTPSAQKPVVGAAWIEEVRGWGRASAKDEGRGDLCTRRRENGRSD